MKITYSLLAIVALVALPGCGTSVADLCDDICECTGCSDREYDECVDEGEDIERDVEDEGCEDEFDEYLACASDEFECHGDDYDLDGCGNENEDLGQCLN